MATIPMDPELLQEEPEVQEYVEKPPELDDDQKTKLLSAINNLDQADKPERDRWIPIWRKLEYMWSGWQKITWDPSVRDWRSSYDLMLSGDMANLQPEDLFRNVNIYRALLESNVAALSASLPNVRFFPEDADTPEDVTTARAYSKISEKIDIEGDSSLTFVRALYILCNQSFVAFYNYYERDKKYGIATIPNVGIETREDYRQFCPTCGSDVDEELCPNCGTPPEVEVQEETVPTIEGYDEIEKGCEVIEAWGPLNVKVLHGVKSLKDSPYLILETDCHETILKSIFPDIADKIQTTGTRTPDTFNRTNVYNPDMHVIQRVWLRPCVYHDDEEATKAFPNGMYIVVIDGQTVAEVLPESLDEHWTITESPLAKYIHADPLGLQLSHVQEMVNELVDIIMQTIEQGAEQIFADPRVLDFALYGTSEVKPGTVFPAKALPNSTLANSFHSMKAATLSQEVDRFRYALTEYGQLVSGATPSIYGGAIQGGSNTYKEYEASRNQALQRLSLIWKMLCASWAKVKAKAVKSYISELVEDEKFVKKFGNSFVSVHIRQSELTGKVGRCAPEVADQLPTTWTQKRGTVMELLQTNLPQLISTFFHPENTTLMKDLFGLTDLYIPGEDDRIRQLFDIKALLESQPMEVPGMMDPATGMEGPPMMQSSIPPNVALEDNEVRIQVLRAWLLSEVGDEAKIVNPGGYANVMAQLNERVEIQNQQMAEMPQEEGGEGDKAPSESNPPELKQ